MKTRLIYLLSFFVLLCGCTANRAAITAASGQVVDAAALVKCANVVARHPDQGPVLIDVLNKAQAQIDAGSPLAALLSITNQNISPETQAEIAIVGVLLQQKMQAFMAAAQGAVNGCRMGILSQSNVKK